MRRVRRGIEDESGNSIVEMALTMALLLTGMFGIMDCSRALYVDHFVAHAAREASRYAMVRGSSWSGTTCASTTTVECMATQTNVKNYVVSLAPQGVNTANLTVAATWTGKTAANNACVTNAGTNSPGCVVSVAVSYPYSFVVPFLPAGSFTLASTSSVSISQ